MAHFDPLQWTIDMESYDSKSLQKDGITRSVLIHEYIHYVQSLVSTVGRVSLLELVRNIIFAGLYHHYGEPLPQKFEQIDLKNELLAASPGDFINTPVENNFRQTYFELQASLSSEPIPINDTVNTSSAFVLCPLTVKGLADSTIADYPHVIFDHSGNYYLLPLSDRIIFENMARQIQRNYLYFSVGHTDFVDHLEGKLSEEPYLCLWRLLNKYLGGHFDARMWTITLCQISLMCKHPGKAFIRIYDRITTSDVTDLEKAIEIIRRDRVLEDEYDKPPLQEIVNELILQLGTAMKPHENYELGEFIKQIESAYNTIHGNRRYFDCPILEWRNVKGWMRNFGCPPVQFADRMLTFIECIPLGKPWHEYLRLGVNLLIPNLGLYEPMR